MDRGVKHYPLYYGGVKQVYPNVPPGSPIYARSVVAGNLVFCSGVTARDVATGKILVHDIRGQMLVVLDKLKDVLEETGSCLNNIIKTLMLLKDLKDYSMMRKTELEYYQKPAPLLETAVSQFSFPAAQKNDHGALEEPMKINHQIVFSRAQLRKKRTHFFKRFRDLSLPQLPEPPFPAGDNHPVQIGVIMENIGGRLLDDPGDIGVRP